MQDPRDTLGYRVKRLQSVLRARMDEALAAEGLTTPQFAALVELAREPGLTSAELARRCFVTAQTMHRITAGLREAGLVRVEADAADAKRRRLFPGPAARRRLERAGRLVADVESEMIEGVGAADVRRVARELDACRARLERGKGGR